MSEKNSSETKRSKSSCVDWLNRLPGFKQVKRIVWKKDEDGSLSWHSRIIIYVLFFCLSFVSSKFIAKCFLTFLNHSLGFNFENSQYIVGMFFLIVFGIGIAIVRTADAKKQFEDTFIQKNEQRLERAINLFRENGNVLSQSLGLKLLAKLRNDSHTDYKSEIDSITSYSVRIEEAKLRGADLRNAKLDGAFLDRANFIAADLRGASLNRSNLERTKLRLADLRETSLNYANFYTSSATPSEDVETSHGMDIDLLAEDLPKSIVIGGKFADLRGASLDHADLKGANLGNADLRGASLDHANLKKASLYNADLRGASLDYADLTDINLKDATYGTWKNERLNKVIETKFPKDFSPEKHGMKRVDRG